MIVADAYAGDASGAFVDGELALVGVGMVSVAGGAVASAGSEVAAAVGSAVADVVGSVGVLPEPESVQPLAG